MKSLGWLVSQEGLSFVPSPTPDRVEIAEPGSYSVSFASSEAEIVEAQLGRALDPLHPQGHAAAVDLLNRIMPPETRATLAGDPDAPVAITRIERIIIVNAG